LIRLVNSNRRRHVGPHPPLRENDKWVTRGARCAGHAVSRFFRPSLASTGPCTGRPLCCLHFLLIAFLSPLVARAQETSPSQVGAAIAFASLWSPLLPSLLYAGGADATEHARSSPSVLYLARFLTLYLFYFIYFFLVAPLLLHNPLLMLDLFALRANLMKDDVFLVLSLLPSFGLTPCCTIHSSCRICSLFTRIL
jgi:hypothetical protein